MTFPMLFVAPLVSMASPPTVVNTATTSNSSSTSTLTVNLPASYASGDLLMVFLGNGRGDNDLSSPPSGWTKLSAINNTNGDAASLIIAYKTATGSEGSTVDFTYDGSTGRPQARSYALRSFTGTPELTSTTANSASSVDPPTVTPSWGTDGAVFIAVMVCSKNATSVTGPTGYSTPVTVTYSGATATNMSLSTSHLSDTVSSENPSAYSIGTTRDALIAATIAVRGG